MYGNGQQKPFRSLRKVGNTKERSNGERNVCVCDSGGGGKLLIYMKEHKSQKLIYKVLKHKSTGRVWVNSGSW